LSVRYQEIGEMASKQPVKQSALETLNDNQQAFVFAYLANGFNATNAAKQAGYSEKTAQVQGSRLLSYAKIRVAIDEQMSALAMPAKEVLARLANLARFDFSEFTREYPVFDDNGNPIGENSGVDLKALKKGGYGWAIKKIKPNEIEFHDSFAALMAIGKVHRLFVDKAEIEVNVTFDPDEWKAKQVSRLNQAVDTIKDFEE